MISSLRQNALTRRPPVPRELIYSTHRNVSISCLKAARISSRHGVSPSGAIQVRLLSNEIPPSQQQSTPHNVPDDVRLVSSVKPRKLELRPGPVKTLSNAQSSNPPEPITVPSPKVSLETSTDIEKEKRVVSSSSSTSTSGASESVIETAKHDYEAAAVHGLLAPPPEGASRIRKLFHQAKELFKFYVRGLKLIYTNRNRVLQIQERVKSGGSPLTRRESRFVHTYRQDIVKLIPFALTIIIAEELIPLMVIYAPFLLPSTCILPSQKERIDGKRRDKQRAFFMEASDIFAAIRARQSTHSSALTADSLLQGNALVYFSGTLGLSTFGPPFRLRRSVKKHLAFIREDDDLLRCENQIGSLTDAELRDAIEERGLLKNSVSPKEWRHQLDWWLANTTAPELEPIQQRIYLIAEAAAK